MSTKHTTKRETRQTRYEWQWANEFEGEPQDIPHSWAENGKVEQPGDDQEQFFAVRVLPGLVLEYEISSSGSIVSGPHRERQAMLVGYVTKSCDTIAIRRIITERNSCDSIKPSANFHCIIALSDDTKTFDKSLDVDEGLLKQKYGEMVTDND